eukprot:137889-Rhodomonas_salina.3
MLLYAGLLRVQLTNRAQLQRPQPAQTALAYVCARVRASLDSLAHRTPDGAGREGPSGPLDQQHRVRLEEQEQEH